MKPRVSVALVLLTALGAWQLLAGREVASPAGVGVAAWRMLADGSLGRALLVSWRTVLEGFLIAAALGVPLGILIGYSERIGDWLQPVIGVLRPIAPFAWIPLAILWFGASRGAAVMITAYAAFFPIVTNVLGGVARVRASMIMAARTLGAGDWTIFLRVVLPGSAPLLLVGLRLGIGLAWAAVIAAELAAGKSTNAPPGIGYLMYLNFASEADTNAIVAMMAVIGLSVLAADRAMRWLQARLVFWPVER
jgi:ABC-type nitrate/sulfonate/bicarbonate transport system permease component